MDLFFSRYRAAVRLLGLLALLFFVLYYLIAFFYSGGVSGLLFRIATGQEQPPIKKSALYHAEDEQKEGDSITEPPPEYRLSL